MGVIKMVLQAFAVFAVPVVILTLLYSVRLSATNTRAVGIGVIRAQGPFFILVGIFYLAFGFFLWSPLPEWLLRRWLKA